MARSLTARLTGATSLRLERIDCCARDPKDLTEKLDNRNCESGKSGSSSGVLVFWMSPKGRDQSFLDATQALLERGLSMLR
jgi:hypothetical protein